VGETRVWTNFRLQTQANLGHLCSASIPTRGRVLTALFGRAEAEALLQAGWRQGALFASNEWIRLPEGVSSEDALIVVLTQSCTVVSPRLEADPFVEVAVARRRKGFNPKDQDASGKNVRKLLLPVEREGFQAVEIDINSRRLLPRDLLLKFAPDGPQLSEQEARKIGGWMARYYARAALPNTLVERIRKPAFDDIKKSLKTTYRGDPLHVSTRSVLIDWEPDDEKGPYKVRITLICNDQMAAEALDRAVPSEFTTPEGDGLSIDVASADAMFVSELDGRIRLTEWDYLSDLGEPQD
jgi:hypothetical protein